MFQGLKEKKIKLKQIWYEWGLNSGPLDLKVSDLSKWLLGLGQKNPKKCEYLILGCNHFLTSLVW